MESVLGELSYYTSQPSYSTVVPILGLVRVVDSPPVLTGDCLMIVLMRSHFFVVIYSDREHLAYGCDSMNLVTNHKIGAELSAYLGVLLVPVRFAASVGVDHCGASAVVIALEFLRQIKREELGREILHVSQYLLRRIIRKLHPEPSRSLLGWTPINQRRRMSCRFCSYSRWNRRSVLLHQRCHMSI